MYYSSKEDTGAETFENLSNVSHAKKLSGGFDKVKKNAGKFRKNLLVEVVNAQF